jgi:uncharacterized membrane protein (UPF0127 family)
MVVRRVVCMKPLRMSRPSFRAPCVLEAEGGAFGRWGLQIGDHLEIKE